MSLPPSSKRLLGVLSSVACLLAAPLTTGAQTSAVAQAPLWINKPDVPAFEKLEEERLSAAQRSVDQILAVKGPHTIENTLVPFDEIIKQYNTAGYLSVLLQQVHPDAAYRDAATAMTSKIGAAG